MNYVPGIGNGSRELMLAIHALANNHCWNNSKRKTIFSTKDPGLGIMVSIRILIHSLLCLNLLNNFKKEMCYKDLLTFISEICFILSLWAYRGLVYNDRNVWIVDLCSVDLRWWGVGEAMNCNVLLAAVLTISSRCLCGRISPAWGVEGRVNAKVQTREIPRKR